MIAKVFIRNTEQYVKDIWYSDNSIIGDVSVTLDKEMALEVSNDDIAYLKKFYAEYNIEIEIIY